MVLKKCNAVCSWIVSLLFLCHALMTSVSFITYIYNPLITQIFAHILAGFVCAHALISIIIFMFCHDGAAPVKNKIYVRNTIIQRVTCLIIIFMLHFHIKAFDFFNTGELLSAGGKIGLVVTELIFFISVFAHFAVSIGPSFISIGLIRKPKTLIKVQISACFISIAMFIFCAVALLKLVISWGV